MNLATLPETLLILLIFGLIFFVGFRLTLSRTHLVQANDHTFMCEFYLHKHDDMINASYLYQFSLPKQLYKSQLPVTVSVYLVQGKTLVPLTVTYTLTGYLYVMIPKKQLPEHISHRAKCRLIVSEQDKERQ